MEYTYYNCNPYNRQTYTPIVLRRKSLRIEDVQLKTKIKQFINIFQSEESFITNR